MSRFAIRSTNIILQDLDLPTEAILLILNEKIHDIILIHPDLPPETLESIYNDWEVQDYGNLYIFPGVVDSNVHLHTNFGLEWENITYSTELAAAGGVTTIIDNPIMSKAFTTGEDYIKSLQQRIRLIKSNSKVDFGLYGLLEPRTEEFIDKTLEIGVLGLKCYLMNCFQNTIGHYPPENFNNLLIDLEAKFPDLLLIVHPEIATERELYSSSPCRTFIIEKRLDMNYAIKSLEFGGGAHKGSYIDDFAKKGDTDDEEEENECPTATLDTPSKLRGRIKKTREKSEIDDLVHFELVSYSFGQKGVGNTDESNSDSEFNATGTGEVDKEAKENLFSPSLLIQQRKSGPPPKLINPKMLKKSIFAVSNVEEDEEEGALDLCDGISQQKTLIREPLAQIQELGKEEAKESKQCLTKEDLQEEDQYQQRGRDMNHGKSSISRHLESEIKEEKDEDSSGSKEARKIDLFSTSRRRKQDTYYEASEEEDDDNDNDEFEEDKFQTQAPQTRQRYQNQVESEDNSPIGQKFPSKFGSMSSYKDQRSTFDLSEVGPSKEIITSEDITFQRSSRKFDSLITYSEDQNHTSISPTRTGNAKDSRNIDEELLTKQPGLVMNLSLVDQTSLVLEGSPNHKSSQNSLNMSPLHSNRANTPAGSSLLARRMSMSRKSSCGGGVLVSTSSTLSSPVSGFNRINPLNVTHISKNMNRNEAVYNQSYRIFLANRPQSWEENAVSLILNCITPECKVKVMLQNLSLATSMLKIREKKKENSVFLDKIISDCSPSHLFFTERMVKKGEAKYKVSPPFRNKENRQNLIENLRLGGIDTMGSYHFYVPPRFKAVDDGNFRRAFNGLDSMGCSLQAAWTASYSYQQKNNKRFAEEPIYQKVIICNIIRQLYKAMCFNTAKALNISHRKGSIAKGKDADLVIWDPFKVDGSQLNPNHVFSGKALLGTVYKTYLRGHLIYNKDDNDLVCKDYKAEFIKN